MIRDASSEPVYRKDRIRFPVSLDPFDTWHVCLDFIPYIDGRTLYPIYGCHAFEVVDYEREPTKAFLDEAASVKTRDSDTLSSTVIATLDQAREDLANLRLNDLDHGPHAWTIAAGLPVYTALFGRDTLTTSWQSAMLGTGMLKGTLIELAACAGKEVNDWRDEQPGRMIHQMNTGPLAVLNYGPLGVH